MNADTATGPDTTPAKLRTWMVEMAKTVGRNRTPREDIADVIERMAGEQLKREWDETVARLEAAATEAR